MAIGDWLKSYHDELVALFEPPKQRLPSYSTIRRTLLRIDDQKYSACLSRFFYIEPKANETIATDGLCATLLL
ncbi:MAG: transposase family protein [Moorea sp. SIO4G3]|nr:transposase family protein [Moorena sp. SIO4G3]